MADRTARSTTQPEEKSALDSFSQHGGPDRYQAAHADPGLNEIRLVFGAAKNRLRGIAERIGSRRNR